MSEKRKRATPDDLARMLALMRAAGTRSYPPRPAHRERGWG
jgi:hypothetical protein